MSIKVPAYEVLPVLNERYKDRDKSTYQAKIDFIVSRIDFTKNVKSWQTYVEETYLDGHTDYKGQDIINNALFDMNTIEFRSEATLYFIYKILLAFKEMDVIKFVYLKLLISKYEDYKHKEFIDKIIDSAINDDNASKRKKMSELDNIAKISNFEKNIMIPGRFTSVSSILLRIKKNKSFIPNKSTQECIYKIKAIQENEVREIICPVCGIELKLKKENKDVLFVAKKSKIEFICNHEISEFVNKRAISFSLKEYSKKLTEKRIDEVDFVIFNYLYFFNKFLENEKKTL